jgi:hypothetical protein
VPGDRPAQPYGISRRLSRGHNRRVPRRKPSPFLVAAILATHLAVTSLTWRSLKQRSRDQVRGSKRFWRLASSVNTGWSLAYFLFGRKRVGQLPEGDPRA